MMAQEEGFDELAGLRQEEDGTLADEQETQAVAGEVGEPEPPPEGQAVEGPPPEGPQPPPEEEMVPKKRYEDLRQAYDQTHNRLNEIEDRLGRMAPAQQQPAQSGYSEEQLRAMEREGQEDEAANIRFWQQIEQRERHLEGRVISAVGRVVEDALVTRDHPELRDPTSEVTLEQQKILKQYPGLQVMPQGRDLAVQFAKQKLQLGKMKTAEATDGDRRDAVGRGYGTSRTARQPAAPKEPALTAEEDRQRIKAGMTVEQWRAAGDENLVEKKTGEIL